jgi:large subunit ribosomal protein L22
MQAKAIYRNARMSPRKIRPLSRILIGLSVRDADAQLRFMPGKAATILRHTLRSAVANAVNNLDLQETDLQVGEILVDKGLVFKRYFPAPKGMAHEILKRNAHVVITVKEKAGTPERKKKKSKAAVIETFSVSEYAAAEAQENHDHSEHEHGQKDSGKQDTKQVEAHQPTAVDTRGKSYEASEKMRANQQGGDPKKTGRRKSLAK